MRQFLFWAGLLCVAFLLLTLRPYMGTIGLVLFILVLIVALAGFGTALFGLYSKAAIWYMQMREKRLELADREADLEQKRINQSYIITEEGQRAYGFFRNPGDTREFTPLADPTRVTNNYKLPATVVEEPPQALLEGPRLPEAEQFRMIWPSMSVKQVILGYRLVQGSSRAIFATLALLLSSLIVGRPGTGKTSLMRFLVAIILKSGGYAVLWDPHNSILKKSAQHAAVFSGFKAGQRFTRRDEDRPSHLVYLARNDVEMQATLNAIDALLEQRKAQGEDHPFIPFFWLADEWLSIYEKLPDAMGVLLRVVTEGRKYRMYATVAGHNFNAACIGGTRVKENCSTQFAFRTTERQASLIGFETATYRNQFLSIINEEFGDIPESGLMEEHDPSAGWCLLQATVLRPTLVKIPLVEAEDMLFVFDEALRYFAIATPEDLLFEEEGPEGSLPGALDKPLPPLPMVTLAAQLWAKERAQGKAPHPDVLKVSGMFPNIPQETIWHIWFWYVGKKRGRRELIELMGGEGTGGRYYTNVIKPVCNALVQVRGSAAEQEEVVG